MVGLRIGNKVEKPNPRNPQTAGLLHQETPIAPLRSGSYGPPFVPDYTSPQKPAWGVRILEKANPKTWRGKKPPANEQDQPATHGSPATPPDATAYITTGQPPSPDPALDAAPLFEAGTSSRGEAFPSYNDSTDNHQVKVTRNDPGRPWRPWDHPESEHKSATRGATEVEGSLSPAPQELPSGSLAGPPQELSAAPPPRSTGPESLAPPISKWHSNHEKTLPNRPYDPPGAMVSSRPPTTLNTPRGAPTHDGIEQARAAARSAFGNPVQRQEGRSYNAYRPDGSVMVPGALAHGKDVPPRQSSKDTIDTTRSNAPPNGRLSGRPAVGQPIANGDGITHNYTNGTNAQNNTPAPLSESPLQGDSSGSGTLYETQGEGATRIQEPETGSTTSQLPPSEQTEYEEQADRADNLQHQLLSMQAERDRLHRAAIHAENECKYHASEVERLRNVEEDLLGKLSAKSGQVRNLSTAITSAKTDIADLERKINAFRNERNRAEDDYSRLEAQSARKREDLESMVASLKKANEANVRELKTKHDVEVSDFRGLLQSQEEEYESQLESQRMDYEERLRTQDAGYESQLESQRMDFEERLQSQDAGYMSQLSDQQKNYEGQLRSRGSEHKLQLRGVEEKIRAETADKVAKLENTVATLRTKIAEHSSSMHYKPLADSHFKQALGSLAQRITNLAASVPRSDRAAAKPLDPSGFLDGESQPRHWGQFLRHITWQMMLQGFFQYPLGFGAFGHEGEGQQELYQFYRLFAHSDPADPEGGLRLPNDAETNAGRAWFFGGILRDIRSRSAMPSSPEKYQRLFRANTRSVEACLLATLQHVSGGHIEASTEGQVAGLVSDFGLLALEMASQRSHVMLEACAHGEVAAAEKFRDGDGVEGAELVVADLMTQPAMIRIGDGLGELHAEVVLAQGDVVALARGRRSR